MKGEFNRLATVLNKAQGGTDGATVTLTIEANAEQYWVPMKVFLSHTASTATDFDNLKDNVIVLIAFGGSTKWTTHLHPGNGGTSSLEFENGPWEFDLSPGLYTGTLDEEVIISSTQFGTGISGILTALYQ